VSEAPEGRERGKQPRAAIPLTNMFAFFLFFFLQGADDLSTKDAVMDEVTNTVGERCSVEIKGKPQNGEGSVSRQGATCPLRSVSRYQDSGPGPHLGPAGIPRKLSKGSRP
jgi:hypothetical protein